MKIKISKTVLIAVLIFAVATFLYLEHLFSVL